MANITVAALIITNAAVDHMWERHLIASEQVRAILDGRYQVIPNHGDAPYRLAGRDHQGRCIAAPIVPTDDPLARNPCHAHHAERSRHWRLSAAACPILAEGEVLEGINVPNPKLILRITLERDEVHLLAEPAQAANMPVGRYIKQVALAAARAFQDEQAKLASWPRPRSPLLSTTLHPRREADGDRNREDRVQSWACGWSPTSRRADSRATWSR